MQMTLNVEQNKEATEISQLMENTSKKVEINSLNAKTTVLSNIQNEFGCA